MFRTHRFPMIAILGLMASAAQGNPPTVSLEVWPGQPPGDEGRTFDAESTLPDQPGRRQVVRLTNVTTPTVSVYQPTKDTATGTAIIVCPGGGYNILAMDLEGTEVAEWLNSLGVTAIVLKYRVPRRDGVPKHRLPLHDAQRAISLVRAHSGKWNVAADRIGVLGFSAGGNLSAMSATNWPERSYAEIDDVDKVSCRPDFAVLVYPAYLVEDGHLVPELKVDERTPPMFLVHAYDDRISPENSVGLFLALKKVGVPAELHVYETGGHGFGLRASEHSCASWPARCEDWLRHRGLLSAN